MRDYEYISLGRAEFKMADLLNKLVVMAPELCKYLSYKKEASNDYNAINLKIDGESYYTSRYRDLCTKLNINLDSMAKSYNFSKVVIIEITNSHFPYATMYVYHGEDECEETEYNIGLHKNSCTIESMINDIKDLWRI